MPWAMPSQTAETALKTASKNRAIGPRPVRTARGAGRRLRAAGRRVDFFLLGFFFDAVRLVLRVLRARVVEAPRVGVLLLREPGGEDVRVAMSPT
jgi:Zn-dependent protease with chaperone function